MNILIINGHEYWESAKGTLNWSIFEATKSRVLELGHQVETSVIDQGYDIASEVDKICWADLVIYITPVYWFSITAKFKEYQDRVFTGGKGRTYRDDGRSTGGAYGSGGLLKGKKYMLVTTWNAPEEAFELGSNSILAGLSVDDIFRHFHIANSFVGMEALDGFNFFNVKKNPDLSSSIEKFKEYLTSLIS